MTREEILKKVESIEDKNKFDKRCLSAGLCPGCGKERGGDITEIFDTLFYLYKDPCSDCNYETSVRTVIGTRGKE